MIRRYLNETLNRFYNPVITQIQMSFKGIHYNPSDLQFNITSPQGYSANLTSTNAQISSNLEFNISFTSSTSSFENILGKTNLMKKIKQ